MNKDDKHKQDDYNIAELSKADIGNIESSNQMKVSEELHKTVLLNISDAVFITDDAGQFTFICPNANVIFGYSFEEVRDMSNISKLIGDNLFNPDQLKSSGEIHNIERVIIDKNGNNHDLLINIKSVSIQGGTLLYSCRDISERKKMEIEIQETKKALECEVKERTSHLSSTINLLTNEINERKKAENDLLREKLFSDYVINSLPGIFYLFDERGNILKWNKNFIKITGYSSEETENLHFFDLFCENDNSSAPNQLQDILSKGASSCEATFQTRNGTQLPYYCTAKLVIIDKENFIVGTGIDISRRKLADEKLQKNYRLLDAITRTQSQFITDVSSRTLFNKILNDFISLTGSEYGFIGEILYTSEGKSYLKTHSITNISWNDETEAFYNKHAPSGMEFFNLKTLFGDVITSGKPLIYNAANDTQRTINLPDGHPPLNCFIGLPLYKVDKLVGMVGLANSPEGFNSTALEYLQPLLSTCGNIIEEYRKEKIHKEAERALSESEERFKGIVDNINIGVTLISPDRKVLLVNKKMLQWFPDINLENESICSKTFRHLHIKDKCYNCPTSRTLKDGQVHEQTIDIPKGGESKSYRIISSPIKDNDGSIISVIELLEDITEQNKLKEQLLHVQKMDSIGTLAGGVAHDFNNIITAIIGFTSVLNRRMPDKDPSKLYIEQIQTAAEHAANLTSSLLTFSRKQKINPISVNINDIVRKMEKFLLRIIGEDIEISIRTCTEELQVMADINHIEQVLMNLAGNARDAMPGGGFLSIHTESITFTPDFIKSHGYGTPGEYAIISISDTGTGMDEKTREKIFEPFYTTKEVNKGTGLGLSIVYGIIKQHNGYISVESTPGKGSSFIIYLPIKASHPEAQNSSLDDAYASIKGTETILIAEDDTMIRNIISSELKEFGYNVIAAVNGEDALSKFSEHRERIDCVLLDLIMPKKSGKDVYDVIKKLAPDIKVIFLSGYSSEIIDLKESFHHGTPFISKPVKPEVVMRSIRELFDNTQQ